MPDLEPIGRVENPDELDLDPVRIPVIGYTLEREEISETFAFKPVMPAGAMAAFLRNAGADGTLPFGITVACIEKCLLADQVEAWQTYLDRDDVMIEQDTFGGVFNALVEHYSARPTRPPSSSRSSGPGAAAKRTSRAAARSKASRSKTSRSA